MASRPRYAPREHEIIYAAARAGRTHDQIVDDLAAEGFERNADGVRQTSAHWRGLQDLLADRAEAAARATAAPLRGVRHRLFPTVTLPRLTIQAGWAS